MNITYSYSILSLKKKDFIGCPDTIYSISWRKTGVDENGYISKCDVTECLIDPSAYNFSKDTDFVSYSELSEQDILNWIEFLDILHPESNSMIEDDILSQIEKDVEVSDGSFPWQ